MDALVLLGRDLATTALLLDFDGTFSPIVPVAHPPVAVDKGMVVQARAAGMTAVAYIGDSEGDLPAVAALARLQEPRG